MKEDEARERWCPFARTLDYVTESVRVGDEPQLASASVNREIGPYDAAGNETVRFSGRHRCIASECMAWRISDRPAFRHEEMHQEQQPVGEGWYAINPAQRGPGKTWLRDVPLGPEGGFCGLAGAPR